MCAYTRPRLIRKEKEREIKRVRKREKRRGNENSGRKEGRKEGYVKGKRTHGGCPDKYYCNYTLRFISCERALMGVDGIIYHGTLIKIIIRALNRGENGMGIMFTFPCGHP